MINNPILTRIYPPSLKAKQPSTAFLAGAQVLSKPVRHYCLCHAHPENYNGKAIKKPMHPHGHMGQKYSLSQSTSAIAGQKW
jgi:hypothetical protein